MPVKFFGQDPQPTPALTLPASGASVTARNAFLSNLDLSTVGTEDFTAVTVTDPATPGATFSLSFAGGSGTITGAGSANNGRILSGDDGFGAFATSPSNFLKATGDLSITFSQPISAFGFYLTDVETVDAVRLTLTPDGGGPDVVLEYGGIINSGSTGQVPGNGQVNFVGFIDAETLYTTVEVSFPGTNGEGFGFDDLTVGDASQVTSEQVTVTQANIGDGPGWRLLGAPVSGVTVDALALQNLVQGVPAGNGQTQQQYPDAPSNLYTAYNGGGRYDYTTASTTGFEFEPGRGYWWYWYDQNIDPPNTIAGGGTSESVELSGFSLTSLGDDLTANVVRAFTDNANSASDSGQPDANPSGPNGEVLPADDDFYMLANPFPEAFRLSGVTATGGTLQDLFVAWDPLDETGQDPTDPNPTLDGPGSYIVLSATGALGAPDSVSTWQGFMAEVTSPTTVGGTVEFTYAVASSGGTGDPPFYGRRAPELYGHLELQGTTASGARVRDAAAYVRVRDEAALGWDRFDFSKPLPPTPTYALVAPVGERDGEAYRQAVVSLPAGIEASVPVAFAATEAGAYTLTWAGDLGATLVDRVTGNRVALTEGATHAFEAEATPWTERFAIEIAASAVAAEDGPEAVVVGTPFPNPTASGATLQVRLAEAGAVTVSVYDALGRRVRSLEAGVVAADTPAALAVPTAGLAPGAYTVRVDGPTVSAVRSLTVVR
ncbi:MAG: T9SS type A sorting domain-containing protein [Bacteroidota bacterium]